MKRIIAYVCLALLLVGGIGGAVGYNLHQKAQKRAHYDLLLAQFNQHCDDLFAMLSSTRAKQLIQETVAHGATSVQLGMSYAQAPVEQRSPIAKQFLGEIKTELDDVHEVQELMRPHFLAATAAVDELRKQDPKRYDGERGTMSKRLHDAQGPLNALNPTFGFAAATVDIKTQALTEFKAAHNGSDDGFDDNAEMLKAATAVLDAAAAALHVPPAEVAPAP